MTAEAQEANRPWDGRRLLRFLTSLAMLALAVTLQLPAATVTTAAEAAPAAVVVAEVAVAPVEQERVDPLPPVDALVVPAPVPAPVVLTGIVPVTGDPRGPPTR
ncbi:hypothetical protein [Actinoplanes awajinensis]|uniref:Uncharacterized protein n=1 Tax=Actinoplanes awajinensis subsp. mycoplanecinus TaxID=135947 RepID=A0A101JTB4_9ACTN|nr:hypothetical protein [Actinoplanes awajinensis]KUL32690.1 hypothetical protein ADL15_19445 [Actinoplanes awajinensis subsp. mycoplanecinus]